MKTPRRFFSCVYESEDKMIYAIGGRSGMSYLESCEAYDVVKNEWTDIPNLE